MDMVFIFDGDRSFQYVGDNIIGNPILILGIEDGWVRFVGTHSSAEDAEGWGILICAKSRVRHRTPGGESARIIVD